MALETWSILVGTILGLGAIVGWLGKKVKKSLCNWSEFMRDWRGEEASDGRDASPGVMYRLNKLDGELSHNGGKSLKDLVAKIEKRQTRLEAILGEAEKAHQHNHEIILTAIQTLSPQTDKK